VTREVETAHPEVQVVTSMTDLIQYQDGSVVSRTILKRESGSVTLFAFDQSQGLSEHTAPYDALVHLLDGEAEITIDGKAHRVKQGEMIIMPANHPHALKAVTRFKMVLTMLRS
jgi:quercetin dioxygenase-like cupin family protein